MLIITTLTVMLLASSSALPTRASTTETGTRGSSSGGRSGSGDNCESEMSSDQINTLVADIQEGLAGLFKSTQTVRVWTAVEVRAAVGVYGDRVHNILESDMTLSDYGHAIAESVSYLQMFLRPVGDILTNETVREVKYHEAGFADNFSDVRDHLEAVAKGVYNLVKGSQDIHECILPNIPDNSFTILNPQPPVGVSNATYRDMVVDGVAYELGELAANLRVAFTGYYENEEP